MSLLSILKDLMIFNNANSYRGQATAFTPPKLARKFEGHRAAGMDREVMIDMGGEALECEFTCAGDMRDVVRQYGMTDIAGVMLRFVGVLQNDETGQVENIEIIVRGRHQGIDRGEWKPGEKADFKVKSALVYYRETRNGRVEVEIDTLNMVEIVGGVDRLAARRAALGI